MIRVVVMGCYYTAEVCINGHCISSRVEDSPELRSKFCPFCGSETITHCTNCSVNIRGEITGRPGAVARELRRLSKRYSGVQLLFVLRSQSMRLSFVSAVTGQRFKTPHLATSSDNQTVMPFPNPAS